MNNVLIVLSPTTDAPAAVAYALRRAKELRGELVGLVTLRPDAAQQIATTLADKAFIGEKVSEDVIDALEREQRTQPKAAFEPIAIQARRKGSRSPRSSKPASRAKCVDASLPPTTCSWRYWLPRSGRGSIGSCRRRRP